MSSNTQLHRICFDEFSNNRNTGFSSKKISVNIENTFTEKFQFRVFGHRDENMDLYIAARVYKDQGDKIKMIKYDPNKTIERHIVSLVREFENDLNR